MALSQQPLSSLPTNFILRTINQKNYSLPILNNLRGVDLPIRILPIANEMIIPNNFLMGLQSRVRAHKEKWNLVLLSLQYNNPLNKTWYPWNECQKMPVRGVYVPLQNPTSLRHPVEHPDRHIRRNGLSPGPQQRLYIWHSRPQTYNGRNLEKASASLEINSGTRPKDTKSI